MGPVTATSPYMSLTMYGGYGGSLYVGGSNQPGVYTKRNILDNGSNGTASLAGLILTSNATQQPNQAAAPCITFSSGSNYYLDQFGNYHFGSGQSAGSWNVISDTSGSAETMLFTVNGGTGNVQYKGTLTQMSDARLKTQIADIDDSMIKSLLKLRPVVYARKADLELADNTKEKTGHRPHVKRQMGLIAQEVMAVLPDLVHQEAQEEGLYSVAYTELISPMLKLLQRQQQQLQTQQQQIDELKGLVRQLIHR